MSADVCLYCGIRPMGTVPIVGQLYCCDDKNNIKFWDLCDECYCTLMFNATLFRDYQIKVYFKKYKRYGVKPKVPVCLWYSVRPPHDIDEREFINRIKKFIKSKLIKKAEYTFEWKYKDNKKRYGIHCHMLLWGKLSVINQHISRQQERYFKLNLKEQKFWIYDQSILKDKQDYVNGITLDDNKNIEKEMDRNSRKILGIPNTLYKEL